MTYNTYMENTTLSPEAQAVLDAYRSIWLDEPLESDVDCLAAALRAAADQLDHATSAHTLYAIAEELEAL
jgi:protoheme ferro-lyase